MYPSFHYVYACEFICTFLLRCRLPLFSLLFRLLENIPARNFLSSPLLSSPLLSFPKKRVLKRADGKTALANATTVHLEHPADAERIVGVILGKKGMRSEMLGNCFLLLFFSFFFFSFLLSISCFLLVYVCARECLSPPSSSFSSSSFLLSFPRTPPHFPFPPPSPSFLFN